MTTMVILMKPATLFFMLKVLIRGSTIQILKFFSINTISILTTLIILLMLTPVAQKRKELRRKTS